MFHNTLRFACVMSLLASFVFAQRFTTTNAQGLTVVASPSVDDDGDTVIRTITTLGRSAATPTSNTVQLSTTTSGFTTRQPLTAPTVAVASGTVLDYSSYRSRVDAQVSSISVSRVNAYLETATSFGLKVSSGGLRRIDVGLGSFASAVAGIAYGAWLLS